MKSFFLFIMFSIVVCMNCCNNVDTTTHTDKFVVLRVNTSDILIDGKICKKGDTLSDASKVVWKLENQTIKAVNLRTYDIVTFAVLKNDKKTGRIKDYDLNKKNPEKGNYYIKKQHLSTRAGLSTLSDLSEYLQGTFYLMDTIYVESPIPLKTTRYYYITYLQNGENVKKKLHSEGNTIVIERSLFGLADNSCAEVTAKVYFCSEIEDEDHALTDSMIIKVLPTHIK